MTNLIIAAVVLIVIMLVFIFILFKNIIKRRKKIFKCVKKNTNFAGKKYKKIREN